VKQFNRTYGICNELFVSTRFLLQVDPR